MCTVDPKRLGHHRDSRFRYPHMSLKEQIKSVAKKILFDDIVNEYDTLNNRL